LRELVIQVKRCEQGEAMAKLSTALNFWENFLRASVSLLNHFCVSFALVVVKFGRNFPIFTVFILFNERGLI